MLSSTFIPLPLAKCCEDLCLFELSLKQGVRHSTADKQQCVSPAELCCHCQQKRKTSHTQNWAKHLRMYKGAFLFHLSAFLFHLQQRGCSWDGTSVVSIAAVRERLTNVMTPRTGTSAGGFYLLQLRLCEAELFGLCLDSLPVPTNPLPEGACVKYFALVGCLLDHVFKAPTGTNIGYG